MRSLVRSAAFSLAAALLGGLASVCPAQSLRAVPSDQSEILQERIRTALEELETTDSEQATVLQKRVQQTLAGEELPSRLTLALQKVLDEACLLEVAINPESRVKVSPGPASRLLTAGAWRVYLVKVHNQAGVTAPLRVSTPHAVRGDGRNDRDAWLEIEMVDGAALPHELSGDLIEYRLIRLRTAEVGDRAALIAMDVGQGTADIGFRNDTMLLFRCTEVEESGSIREGLEERLLQSLPSEKGSNKSFRLVAAVVDEEDSDPLPARIYLTNNQGERFHVRSLSGEAAPYRKEPKHLPRSQEVHTCVPAGPFYAELTPGDYELVAERGKAYLPAKVHVRLDDEDRAAVLRLRRHTNLARHGWYSGDVHVHREIDDLPAAMLADDLNVAFAINHWVEDSSAVPADLPSHRRPRVERIDATHAISHHNTEYEVISIAHKKAILGSLIALDHNGPLQAKALPLSGIRSESERRRALLDLDKHCWPWSLVAVPIAGVDLFELANNHLWRTEFGFSNFYADYAPDYLDLPRSEEGLTEEGWLRYGFETYYALLNCGFDLKVSAGSASGVHPTPLGYGRVYARVDGPFDFNSWRDSLAKGRSFVTTGPLLQATFNGADPGTTFKAVASGQPFELNIEATVHSVTPIDRCEILRNGVVVATRFPKREEQLAGACASFSTTHVASGSAWYAVRVFSRRDGGRLEFAHTNPVYLDDPSSPLSPRQEQAEWLARCVRRSIASHRQVLDEQSLDEFRQALDYYESLASETRLAQRSSD